MRRTMAGLVLGLVACGQGAGDAPEQKEDTANASTTGSGSAPQGLTELTATVDCLAFHGDTFPWEEYGMITAVNPPPDLSYPTFTFGTEFDVTLDVTNPPTSMTMRTRLSDEFVAWFESLGNGPLDQDREVLTNSVPINAEGHPLATCEFMSACLQPGCDPGSVVADGLVTLDEVFGWMQDPIELTIWIEE